MDDEALRRAARLEAEVGRLNARLDQLKSSFSHRLVAPVRLLERRLARSRKRATGAPSSATIDPHDRSYAAWVARYDTIEAADIRLVRDDIGRFAVRASLSIALLSASSRRAVAQTVESLLGQVHRDFEVLAAPGARLAPAARLALAGRGIAVRHVRAPRDASDVEIVNRALRQAGGTYFMAVVPGDRLAPLATYHLARAASVAGAQPALLYGDEDELGPEGERVRPFFKSDWDPELALAFDYPGAAVAWRTDRLRAVGGAAPIAGRAWRWDVALKIEDGERGAGAAATGLVHIPFVLVHRQPAAPDPDAAHTRRGLVVAALERRGERATIEEVAGGLLSICRALSTPAPLVSIVVPTRDRVDLLRRCVDGVLARTRYPSLDLTIIDNGSREPETAAYLDELRADRRVSVVRDDRPFNFSALHNGVVGQLAGEIVVLLNNDIDVIGPDWLERLVAQAVRPGVGAVGAKLCYPDDTIQHAGVILTPTDTARHAFMGRRRDDPGPHGLQVLARTVSAATGACLAMRRSVFQEVGGMNEALAVDFNDIDLCQRIRRRGYAVIWEPKAELYHVEAATRGRDHALSTLPAGHAKRRRFAAEIALFRSLWPGVVQRDPSYNPNLGNEQSDWGAAFPPRVPKPWAGAAGLPSAPEVVRAPPGVAIVGHLNAEIGLGQAARNCGRAFETVGYPVSYHPIPMTEMFQESVPFATSAARSSPYGTALYHFSADTLIDRRDRLPLESSPGRRLIGFWHWELPVFPAAWAAAFDLIDEVWTASGYTAGALAAATDKPVRVVPHAVAAAGHAREAARARFGLPRDAFVFLTAFDTNSFVARKNPQAVLRAFADAFPGAAPDRPLLVLKCHGRTGRTAAYEALALQAAAQVGVIVIDRVLATDEMAMLHAASDAHVSLHRAEGFGLNLAEAMAEGRLAIGTGFSGNMEFMTPDNSIPIPYRMRAVAPGDYLHGHGQWWAEPEHDAAVEALRLAVLQPARVAALAGRAAADMADRFSFEAIGAQLLRALAGEIPAVARPG